MLLLSRSLHAFVTVAEDLHFGRAAKRLHISQPPLSQLIRQFEHQLGATLFTRTTRNVQLTPAGKAMLERARRLAAEAEAALVAVQRVARGEAGSLTLGFTHSTVYGVLPRTLGAWRSRYPDVTLDLKQLTSDLLLDGVRSGRIDVALARVSPEMTDPDLRVALIAREPMLLVMPAGHKLAALDAVPVQSLHGLPLLHYAPQGSRYFHELVEGIFAAAAVRPTIAHMSILPTLLALVEAGMGLALAPAAAVPKHDGPLVSRPLAGAGEAALATLCCVSRRDNANPALAGFIQVLHDQPPPAAVPATQASARRRARRPA